MFEQHFYIADRFMGSVVRPHVVVHGERQPAYSYAYFCTHCGNVWARCPVTDSNGFQNKWQVQGGCCPENENESPFVVPGSLLISWEPDYNSALLSCPDIVRWEMERHMEFIERRIANDSQDR